MSKKLIMIFVRNPELGRVKTRLAKTTGDYAALKTYQILTQHTASIVDQSSVDKMVFYSKFIEERDLWTLSNYQKNKQSEGDLGERMYQAFEYAFNMGYTRVLLIGSDVYSLKSDHIASAFEQLNSSDVVIGPAVDGGYYLLGLNFNIPEIFQQKQWGSNTVLNATLKDLSTFNVSLLEPLNDIDTFEDLKKEPQLLKKLNSYGKTHQ